MNASLRTSFIWEILPERLERQELRRDLLALTESAVSYRPKVLS